jgi:hypothetical protein
MRENNIRISIAAYIYIIGVKLKEQAKMVQDNKVGAIGGPI